MRYYQSKTMILFNPSKINFVYIVTAPSGRTSELFKFKLGFYRMPWTEMEEIKDFKEWTYFNFISACVIYIAFSLFIIMCLFNCCKNRQAKKKINGFYEAKDEYIRV